MADSPPAVHFATSLVPHRSLSPEGFKWLIRGAIAANLLIGLPMMLLGAWPVLGFMGLDVALIYVAFRLNFRALRLYETVDLTDDALTVTRVAPSGESQSWSFNPYWVRLSLVPRLGRSSELSIASHGKRLVFARFLTDDEREDFASALSSALSSTKNAA